MKIDVTWLENMAFESEINGHKLLIDANESVGGEDCGPRPKPLLLLALGGCTGMDVVSILKKMRVEVDNFNIDIDATPTKEHPVIYEKIHLVYEFTGKDLPMDKLKKAVDLSQERYCGVSAMLKKASDLTFEIKVSEG